MASKKRPVLLAVILLVLALAIAWLALRSSPSVEPAPPVEESAPPEAPQERFRPRPVPPPSDRSEPPAPEPSTPLPESLDDSDEAVQEALQELDPALTEWLTPEQQLRKWVALVDGAAVGKLPAQHSPLRYTMGAFQAREEQGELTMSTANYQRAAPLVDALVRIPPEQLAEAYQHWLPLLEQAYGELGQGGSLEDRLRQAIDHILEIEPLEEPVALQRPSVYYTYDDEELERADPLTKLMWRLGPDNTRRIQEQLRELKKQLWNE